MKYIQRINAAAFITCQEGLFFCTPQFRAALWSTSCCAFTYSRFLVHKAILLKRAYYTDVLAPNLLINSLLMQPTHKPEMMAFKTITHSSCKITGPLSESLCASLNKVFPEVSLVCCSGSSSSSSRMLIFQFCFSAATHSCFERVKNCICEVLTVAPFVPRPCSSPKLPHADTHSRIEHYASRYVAFCTVLSIKSLLQSSFHSPNQPPPSRPPPYIHSLHPTFPSSSPLSVLSPFSLCHTLIEVLICLRCALYSS